MFVGEKSIQIANLGVPILEETGIDGPVYFFIRMRSTIMHGKLILSLRMVKLTGVESIDIPLGASFRRNRHCFSIRVQDIYR